MEVSRGDDRADAAAGADHRISEMLEGAPDEHDELADLVLKSPADRELLADKINDPNQVLVPNTTCATCHGFNELTFNLHNLSYLQEMEMNVSPRVKNDVEHDLQWLFSDQ